jgi:hypothetical protein
MKSLFAIIAISAHCLVQANGQPVLNGAFFDVCKRIYDSSQDPRVIKGRDGWYFLKAEIGHLSKKAFWGEASRAASPASKPDSADPLPAIVDFNNQLKAKGIELIFLPVPAKAAVYPDKLDARLNDEKGKRLDYYHYQFYRKLEEQGVHVLDIMPLLLENREKAGPVFCSTDAHWTPLACEIAASELAKELKKKSWYGAVPKIKPVAERKSIKVSGDLVAGLTPPVSETLGIRLINDGSGKIIAPSEGSPVILMGDSHALVFHEGGDMLAEGAGLADQLAYELNFAVDLIGVRGSGSTASRVNLFRKSKNDPLYLAGKKAVIWCMSVREFTESTGGWKIVPVSP